MKIVNQFHLFPLFNRFTKNSATIFMLHRIDPVGKNTEAGFSPVLLRKYFEYLKLHKYNVISLSNYIDALITNRDTYKAVVFTVDDGYRNFYLNAYKIFKEYGYPATIFITSDFIEGKLFFWWDNIEYLITHSSKKAINLSDTNFNNISIKTASEKKKAILTIVNHCKTIENQEKLDLIAELARKMEVNIPGQPQNEYAPLKWEEIYEMQKHGIDFHPHTKTHPIMSKVSLSQKTEELKIPKKVIEEKLGTTANIFCYPNGGFNDFDEETIMKLKALDYIAAVTGIPGINNTKGTTDMYTIPRFALPADQLFFKQYISGLENFKRKILGISFSRYK